MTKRIVLYGTVYGLIGVTIGVLVALYAAPNEHSKNIILDRVSRGEVTDEPKPAVTSEEVNNE
jgi:hypothetical protein